MNLHDLKQKKLESSITPKKLKSKINVLGDKYPIKYIFKRKKNTEII
jgi:hypothetical protein